MVMMVFCLLILMSLLAQELVVKYPFWKFLGLGEPESGTLWCP